MEVKIQGLDKLNEQLEALGKINHKEALLAGAIKLQSLAQPNAPVDTGFLRASHDSRETDEGAELVVSAEYAIYVHEGTRYMEGRAWISEAIDAHSSEIVETVARVEQELINGEVG
mgnify:CR=1 FL=1